MTVPREAGFVTVKRNVPLTGRSYGHWWVELDGEESYGWWPSRAPLGVTGVIRGTPGALNGLGVCAEGTPIRDPNHGLRADHEFHPVLIRHDSDDDVRAAIRHFAAGFAGDWRWSTRPTMNCRLFQLALMDAAGLVDGTGKYHTRGSGCPALAPLRRVAGRFDGRRRWPRNLPRPGQRVADLEVGGGPTRCPTATEPPVRLASS
ncbi:MAG: neprosin family prolyl endopeptidase [Actinomycetota bacterium]|nr:neprosin family prolyl endopeptidase [Actinomycetota bacterium]